MARPYATQDGPSHIYTAGIVRKLLMGRESPYSRVYELRRDIVPNWSTTLLLGGIGAVTGPDWAEPVLASLLIGVGYLALAYAALSLAPAAPPWSPVLNLLLQTWFFWVGFYNFFLGMMLCVVLVGFYVRVHARPSPGQAALLTAGLVALYFTHLLAVSLALLALFTITVWLRRFSSLALLAGAAFPSLLLLVLFVRHAEPSWRASDIGWAWTNFPLHVFATTPGRIGHQEFLVPVTLCFVVMGGVSLGSEWRKSAGAFAAVTLALMGLYLVVPNAGLGGDEAKIRLSWAVFVFGCLMALSVPLLRTVHTALSLYIAVFLAANLVMTVRTNVVHASAARAEYRAILAQIPPGSAFVRVRYPTPRMQRRFQIEWMPLDPLLHAEATVAARHWLLDLTDYQALSRVFPITMKASFDESLKSALWRLEGPGHQGRETLAYLRQSLPVPLQYVVVLGEPEAPESSSTDLGATLAWLDAEMQPVARNGFVRLYRSPAATP